MEFGITIPMQRHVGLPRPPYGEVDDLLFCWEAHRIALGGCDMLLLANAAYESMATGRVVRLPG